MAQDELKLSEGEADVLRFVAKNGHVQERSMSHLFNGIDARRTGLCKLTNQGFLEDVWHEYDGNILRIKERGRAALAKWEKENQTS